MDSHHMDCNEATRLLGIAWVGSGLYPDPASQDAFRRVVGTLRTMQSPLEIQPGPNSIKCRGEDLQEVGGALRRLAAAAFAHKIGWLRINPTVTPESLGEFLKLLALSPGALEPQGGLAEVLRARNLRGVDVFIESDLIEATADRKLGTVSTPQQLMERFEGQVPSVDAAHFVEELADAVANRYQEVAMYLEAFVRFQPAMQEAIVTRLMDESGRELQELFVGQLAGHELAELRVTLGPRAAGFLSEYMEYETGQRGVDVGVAVMDPQSLLTFRTQVAERVEARLRELDVSGFTAELDMPPTSSWTDAALETLRGIFLVEGRADKQHRAARAWSRLTLAAVQRGAIAEAARWHYVGERLKERNPSLWRREAAELAPQVFDQLAVAMDEGNELATELLDRLAPLAIPEVLEVMETIHDTPRFRRACERLPVWVGRNLRIIVELLPALDAVIPSALSLLQGSGTQLATERNVQACLRDRRPSVRSQALELCAQNMSVGDLGRYLSDPAGQVRRTALRLLSRRPPEATTDMLVAALAEASDDERAGIASVLARSSPGRKALKSMVGWWQGRFTAAGRRDRALVKQVLR